MNYKIVLNNNKRFSFHKYSSKVNNDIIFNNINKVYLAKKIIANMKVNIDINANLNEVMEAIDLSEINDFDSVSCDLDNILINSKSTLDSNVDSANFNNIVNSLEKYYREQILVQLQKISNKLKMDSVNKLISMLVKDISISSSMQLSASPQRLIIFLRGLHSILMNQKKKFEDQKKNYTEQEISASEAYKNLKSDISNSSVNKYLLNAIVLKFEAKFNQEKTSILIQVINEQLQQLESYFTYARCSLDKLESIYESLSEKELTLKNKKITDISIITLNQITNEQRTKLETWLNLGIFSWGCNPISWQKIEKKLLENLDIYYSP